MHRKLQRSIEGLPGVFIRILIHAYKVTNKSQGKSHPKNRGNAQHSHMKWCLSLPATLESLIIHGVLVEYTEGLASW